MPERGSASRTSFARSKSRAANGLRVQKQRTRRRRKGNAFFAILCAVCASALKQLPRLSGVRSARNIREDFHQNLRQFFRRGLRLLLEVEERADFPGRPQ